MYCTGWLVVCHNPTCLVLPISHAGITGWPDQSPARISAIQWSWAHKLLFRACCERQLLPLRARRGESERCRLRSGSQSPPHQPQALRSPVFLLCIAHHAGQSPMVYISWIYDLCMIVHVHVRCRLNYIVHICMYMSTNQCSSWQLSQQLRVDT